MACRIIFTSRETLTYFLNIVGIIQYTLPGVFETNPHAGVNWSLWTIPYELKCYVIAALMVPLLRRSPGWIIRFSFIVRARGIDPNAPTEVGAPPPVIDPSSGETLSFGSVGAPSVSPDTSR